MNESSFWRMPDMIWKQINSPGRNLPYRPKLNNTWTLIYAIIFRQDAVREDDIAFSLRLNLIGL